MAKKYHIVILCFLVFQIFYGQRNNQQFRFTDCASTPQCNLVFNGNFEEFVVLPNALNQLEKACNWVNGYGSPDYYNANVTTSPVVDIPGLTFANPNPTVNPVYGGNAYGGFEITRNSSTNVSVTDLIASKLVQPLQSSTNYVLEFDVRKSSHFKFNTSINIQACLAANPLPLSPTGDGSFILGALDLVETHPTPSTNNGSWERLTFNFTTGSTAGQEYLLIGGIQYVLFQDDPLVNDATKRVYYYIDNIVLKKAFNPSFDLPSSICSNGTPINLSQLVGNTTDTFSGPGVTLIAGEYVFNPSIAGVGNHIINYTATSIDGCDVVALTDTIEVTNCTPPTPPYISQVFKTDGKDRFIEIKNADNTIAITPGMYYLAFYQDNTLLTGAPTYSILLGNIPANGVDLFKSIPTTVPAYALAIATDFPNLQQFDGENDIMIITRTNDATAYANRVDELGDYSGNSIFHKDYTQEEYRSLVRMSCTPMGFPRVDYDEQDWVGFNRFGISTTGTYDDSFEIAQGTLTNGELGRHFSEVLRFTTFNFWDDLSTLAIDNTINESLPDRSRILDFEQSYNTSSYGDFEGCSLLVRQPKIVTIASSDYAKIQTSVDVEDFAQFIVEDGGALVMVRDCYYQLTCNSQAGLDLINLGTDGIMKATKQTVAISGPYDYVYLSSPLSNNTANPRLNQIFNFASGTGMFNPNRFYLFQNDKFCDIYKRFSTIVGDTDGYDDNYDDYDPSDTALEQNALMIPGRGYATWPPVPITAGDYNYTITFTGEMNNGIVTVPVFKNNSLSGRNANLIGNPYPSAIDLDKFFAENNTVIEPIAYIWTRVTTPDDPNSTYQGPNGLNYTAANYSVYSPNMSLNTEGNPDFAGDNILASGQSFFVRTEKNFNGFTNAPIAAEVAPISPATIHPLEQIILADTLRFRNYMRTTEPNITFSRMESSRANQTSTSQITGDKLWVNLTDANDFTAQLGIYFKPSGNSGYLPKEDAVTIAGRKYNFYTQSTTEDLIIDVQESFETSKVIPLGITNITGQNQQFTISIPKKGGVFATQEVYLFDSITQTYHNLSSGNFTFTSNEALLENRFSLVFTQNNSNLAKTKAFENLTISVLNDTLTIKSTNKLIAKVQVFDIYTPNTSGLKIAEQTKINATEVLVPVANQFKILNVIVELEDGTIIRKKVMK